MSLSPSIATGTPGGGSRTPAVGVASAATRRTTRNTSNVGRLASMPSSAARTTVVERTVPAASTAAGSDSPSPGGAVGVAVT